MAKRRQTNTPEFLAAAAAYLSCNLPDHPNLTQNEIGELFDVAQPQVSGWIDLAIKKGWYIRREYKWYIPERVGDELHAQVVARFGVDESRNAMRAFSVKHRLGDRAPSLHVLRQVAKKTPADVGSIRPGTTDLAMEAAGIVAALLATATQIGVCWGYHLGLVIGALARLQPDGDARRPQQVVPLAGEPFQGNLNRLSSTSLAQELMTALNGSAPGDPHSLTLVPAVRPYPRGAEPPGGLDDHLSLVPGFTTIFGTADGKRVGVVEGLDTVLCGISDAGYAWGRKLRPMYPAQPQFDALKDALGDIGGVLLPGANRDHWPRLESLQQRWTGLRPRHLKGLATRAANDRTGGTPGVICVTAGRKKAACCLEALRLGYVNHLVTDRELGEELDRLIRADVGVSSEPPPARGQ
jgi:DNA-binding transcriptional regulator LsrR (DeoR family)